jgi:hypothetical protein
MLCPASYRADCSRICHPWARVGGGRTVRQGKWSAVWARFASSTGYDGVVRLLAAEEPPDLLADKGAYPRINTREEKKLRDELLQLINVPLAEARSRVQALDNAHAWRRETVWARRGEAPLAVALKSLTEISAAKTLPTHDGTALAEAYAQYGWAVDWAAIRAIAAVPREIDRAAVITALRAIYIPWLDEGATSLQELVRQGKVQLAKPEKKDNPDTLLFVDGLRMDLAHQLVQLLRAEGAQIDLGWSWSGFPTVTATCKPLVSPIAEHLRGSERTSDLAPMTEEGKAVTKPTLFKGMEDAGWETQDSLLADTKLWTEAGRFDEEGHALGARVADRIVGGIRGRHQCRGRNGLFFASRICRELGQATPSRRSSSRISASSVSNCSRRFFMEFYLYRLMLKAETPV